MKALRLLVVSALVPLALAGAAQGQSLGDLDETYDCGLLAVDDAGAQVCADDAEPQLLRAAMLGVDGGSPGNCRFDGELIVWTGSDWLRIGGAIAADRSP